MSPHPSSDRLDALAAGDDDAQAGEHLAACEACRAYVARAGAEIARFRAAGPAPARFAERVEARAKARAAPGVLAARSITFAAPALAAAAALALLLRGGAPGPGEPPAAAAGSPLGLPAPGDEAASRFKGGPVLALVRERGGRQERLSGEVAVREADRVRAEVSLDAAGPLAVGFLGDDGEFVPLSPPAFVEAGTHFSAEALRFERGPNGGYVVAGTPEAVERVRQTKRLDGVIAARIVDER
ncbi:MAG TPA: hypothetical protein VFS43_33230 [Polyangiaceae bacterium]|nr:hypothetical protein [Polyangiaceae bacterium]